MVKRMFLMLAVMLIFSAALGFVKFQQIQTPLRRARRFSHLRKR